MLQENSDLQESKVLHGNNELPKPNLRKFTEDEMSELLLNMVKLMENGQEEEALKFAEQIPIMPILLQDDKERYGIEHVIRSGQNLSEAVEEYGEEWLEN